MTKAVTTTETNLPAVNHDYGADAGAGVEDTSGKDLSIPFIGILQALSPQVSDENPVGSKAGMLYNTVTQEITEGDVGNVFLPVHKTLAFVEWVPEDQGGGFVGTHTEDSEVVLQAIADNGGQKFGDLITPEGNELVETHYVYGLTLDDEGKETTGFGVIPFKKTQIKPCRNWLTAMYTLKGKPPMFANRARIKTVKQQKDKYTFFNFQIQPLEKTWKESLIDPMTEASLLAEAKDFRDMVVSGMAKPAHETDSNSKTINNEDAPF